MGSLLVLSGVTVLTLPSVRLLGCHSAEDDGREVDGGRRAEWGGTKGMRVPLKKIASKYHPHAFGVTWPTGPPGAVGWWKKWAQQLEKSVKIKERFKDFRLPGLRDFLLDLVED